jgi:hypothetical protein
LTGVVDRHPLCKLGECTTRVIFDQQSPADVWASKLPYPGRELGLC